MLVNPVSSPAPAFWQGLMLIGLAVWVPWLLSLKFGDKRWPVYTFLALWTVGTSVLTAKVFT